MSASEKSSEPTYSDQLSDFENQLRYTMNDDVLQQDVFRAVRELLHEHKESEQDIRRILLDRFEAGQLREETLQTVQHMLDQLVSEYVDTMPDPVSALGLGDETSPEEGDKPEAPASEEIREGTILRDRFLLQKRVSGGSMGVVYRALDRRLAEVEGEEPWVAIKVLSPRLSRNANALKAMQQEAAKGRRLSHPNIVRFIDLDRDDDTYFLVMEWIEGRSLAEMLDDPAHNRMDPDEVLDIVDQLANALDYAHRSGVIHADVKPGNVMLQPDGGVKLIDFGVARVRQQEQTRASDFDPGVLGAATPAYSSMQVLTGEDPVPADDVFSLACLTYRMVAGHRVFGPRNAAQAAEEGMTPDRPNGVDDAQWRALKKALSFARVTRYASPREFVDELLQGRPSASADVDDDNTAVNARPPFLRSRLPWAAAASVVLVALAATWLMTRNDTAVTSGPAPQSGEVGERAGPEVAESTQFPETAASSPDTRDDLAGVGAPVRDEFAAGAGTAPEREAETAVSSGADDEVPRGDTAGAAQGTTASANLPATHTLVLGEAEGSGVLALPVRLREDAEPAIVEVRRGDASAELELEITEVRPGGSISPAEAGQYELLTGSKLVFPTGISSVRIELAATPDTLREADRSAELVFRDASGNERGIIDLTIEDDDQRRLEASLSPDTVGFAVSTLEVSERDTAVQIDLLRYRPGPDPLSIRFRVDDVTATRDEDYFPPSGNTVTFGPGERSARLLVPLVQDADVEGDESFVIELEAGLPDTNTDIFRRIAVMIRDDDR